jgi:hypothetical protein
MMKIWEKLSTWQKRATTLSALASAVAAMAGMLWVGANAFATDKEVVAEVSKVEHKLEQYIVNKTLYDARRSLQQVKFQLLDPGISDAQRQLLEESKKELQHIITCVQSGNEHCEQ